MCTLGTSGLAGLMFLTEGAGGSPGGGLAFRTSLPTSPPAGPQGWWNRERLPVRGQAWRARGAWLWRPPTLKRGGPLRVTQFLSPEKTEAEPGSPPPNPRHPATHPEQRGEESRKGLPWGKQELRGKAQEAQAAPRKCLRAWDGKTVSRAAVGPVLPPAMGKRETCPGWKDSGEMTHSPPDRPNCC